MAVSCSTGNGSDHEKLSEKHLSVMQEVYPDSIEILLQIEADLPPRLLQRLLVAPRGQMVEVAPLLDEGEIQIRYA